MLHLDPTQAPPNVVTPVVFPLGVSIMSHTFTSVLVAAAFCLAVDTAGAQGQWTSEDLTKPPSARLEHAMAPSSNNTIVMFGSELVGFIVTVIWVVGLINAQNFIDGADGLSAGTAAIAAGWFLVIAGLSGQFLVAALAAALAGCAIGFLRHNFQPARIYMGDAGALFLGFMLAYLGIKVNPSGPDETTFLVPILVLAVHSDALERECRELLEPLGYSFQDLGQEKGDKEFLVKVDRFDSAGNE